MQTHQLLTAALPIALLPSWPQPGSPLAIPSHSTCLLRPLVSPGNRAAGPLASVRTAGCSCVPTRSRACSHQEPLSPPHVPAVPGSGGGTSCVKEGAVSGFSGFLLAFCASLLLLTLAGQAHSLPGRASARFPPTLILGCQLLGAKIAFVVLGLVCNPRCHRHRFSPGSSSVDRGDWCAFSSQRMELSDAVPDPVAGGETGPG